MSCSVHVPLLLYMHPVSAILEHAGTQTDSPEGDINSKAFWSKEKSCGEQEIMYIPLLDTLQSQLNNDAIYQEVNLCRNFVCLP